MSIIINASWARKMPGPVEFSSISAQASLQMEAGSIQEIPQRMREAFALIERSVDEQLRQGQSSPPIASPEATIPTGASSTTHRPSTISRPSEARSPTHPSRRGSAPVTDSQIRYIERLANQTGTSLEAILIHAQVRRLQDLSVVTAGRIIDDMKAKTSPR